MSEFESSHEESPQDSTLRQTSWDELREFTRVVPPPQVSSAVTDSTETRIAEARAFVDQAYASSSLQQVSVFTTMPQPSSHPTKGSSMSLMDILRQVGTLERAIKDQGILVNDFLRSNQDTMQLVRAELKGSTKGYDQQMLSALSQVESSLKNSLNSLQRATDALQRVQSV